MKVLRYVILEDVSEFVQDNYVEAEIEMHAGAELIGDPRLTSKGLVLYALADPDTAELESRTFLVVGNGVELPEGVTSLGYRGTEKIPGALTFHVFDLAKVSV